MASKAEIRVLCSPDELFKAAADQFAMLAQAAVKAKGKFTVALSGGSTPKGLYTLLASNAYPDIPWENVYFFLSDERNVPPDHPDSNYRMANESLLSKIHAEHVYRVATENNDAEAAATAYERTLTDFFELQPGEFPAFDLILLGLGPDGHTASLFPGSAALEEKRRLVVANWVEKFKTYRITFTYPLINHAACVTFLVGGSDKAPALHQIFDEGVDLPARRVQPVEGKLVWLIDQAAGGLLKLQPNR